MEFQNTGNALLRHILVYMRFIIFYSGHLFAHGLTLTSDCIFYSLSDYDYINVMFNVPRYAEFPKVWNFLSQ